MYSCTTPLCTVSGTKAKCLSHAVSCYKCFTFVSVLNKRAVQLVFHREANLLHRTLVTNFSFMDFPLQDFTGHSFPGPVDQQQAHGAMVPLSSLSMGSNSRHGLEAHKTVEDEWVTQFSSFERQLESIHPSKEGVSVKTGLESMSEQSGGRLSADHDRRPSRSGSVTHSEQSANKFRPLSTSFSASSLEALVADTLKPLPSSTQHETPVDRVTTIPQVSSGAGSSALPRGAKPVKVKPSTGASVNANILKTKKLEKSKKSVRQMSASTPLADVEDALPEERLARAGVVAEDVDGVELHTSLSKLELKQLRKAQSERDKFQSDPAKFNHIFNQEVMAYVDACCFAGQVSMDVGNLA